MILKLSDVLINDSVSDTLQADSDQERRALCCFSLEKPSCDVQAAIQAGGNDPTKFRRKRQFLYLIYLPGRDTIFRRWSRTFVSLMSVNYSEYELTRHYNVPCHVICDTRAHTCVYWMCTACEMECPDWKLITQHWNRELMGHGSGI